MGNTTDLDKKLAIKVIDKVDNNFLTYLKGRPVEIKKLRVLEIYRYLYRFSFLRAQSMVDNPIFMMIVYQYIKATGLKRIHQREILRHNLESTYRALENLLNSSCHKSLNQSAMAYAIQDP